MKRKNGKRRTGGFTLVELLLTVLILLMVTAIVAAGIPSAVNAYRKAADAANAQLLLSTTLIRLRDELGKASKLYEVGADAIVYADAAGSLSEISQKSSGASGAEQGIWITQYQGQGKYESSHPLVSASASNKNLYAEFSGASYRDGVITLTDIQVARSSGGAALAELDSYKIRVIAPLPTP